MYLDRRPRLFRRGWAWSWSKSFRRACLLSLEEFDLSQDILIFRVNLLKILQLGLNILQLFVYQIFFSLLKARACPLLDAHKWWVGLDCNIHSARNHFRIDLRACPLVSAQWAYHITWNFLLNETVLKALPCWVFGLLWSWYIIQLLVRILRLLFFLGILISILKELVFHLNIFALALNLIELWRNMVRGVLAWRRSILSDRFIVFWMLKVVEWHFYLLIMWVQNFGLFPLPIKLRLSLNLSHGLGRELLNLSEPFGSMVRRILSALFVLLLLEIILDNFWINMIATGWRNVPGGSLVLVTAFRVLLKLNEIQVILVSLCGSLPWTSSVPLPSIML